MRDGMILAARWIVTLAGPPLENGFLIIENGQIQSTGSGENLQAAINLGNVILFPGLVNAHCHLAFESQRQKLNFSEWVKKMGNPPYPPFSKGGVSKRLLRGGATTIADHCHPQSETIYTPLRRIQFWEVLGSDRERAQSCLDLAVARQKKEGGHISLHSLYAVHPEILQETSPRPGEVLSVHLLESSDEEQFFRHRSGPLWDLVLERGGQPNLSPSSPIQWLAEKKILGPNILLVHGNYLTMDEINLLKNTGTTVVHCPGSHLFFGHKKFPLEELKKNEINIALGTDSLASNQDLSMLREMRLLRENEPSLGAEEILKMATLNGAKALGLEGQIGTLEPGKQADLVAVPIMDESMGPFENILRNDYASFSMIAGQRLL